MKYSRLTKEQFEELHSEFINFLATQSIDKAEWDKIKLETPLIAEQELDVFSDLIWEGVLNRAEYLEHFSERHIFLFHCSEIDIRSIILKSKNEQFSFLTLEGLQWMGDNLFTDAIDITVGVRQFTGDRNAALFDLIRQGAFLSNGELYRQINSVINS